MDLTNFTIAEIKALISSEPTDKLVNAMKNDKRAGVIKLLEKYYREQERLDRLRRKSQEMLKEEKNLWAKGFSFVGGVDEVGRGPLAGPVVAACVILPKGLTIEGVDDSKKLSEAKREELYSIITDSAIAVGIGTVSNTVIDKINIYEATIDAMVKACINCGREPDFLLIDAMQLKDIPIPQLSIVSGDSKSQSIAAASIVAKVTRDREMVNMDKLYPGYGFASNKGYGTKEHIDAIKALGLTPIHRRSFTNKIIKAVP